MDKKSFLTLLLILVILIACVVIFKNKKAAPVENSQNQIEIQNPDNNIIHQDKYIPPELNNSENSEKAQDPNALDYMAPGYKKAQDRLKEVQNIRQNALDEQQKDIDRLNLR